MCLNVCALVALYVILLNIGKRNPKHTVTPLNFAVIVECSTRFILYFKHLRVRIELYFFIESQYVRWGYVVWVLASVD